MQGASWGARLPEMEALARERMLQGDYTGALDLLQQAFSSKIISEQLLWTMAECSLFLGDLDSAENIGSILEAGNSPGRAGMLGDWVRLHRMKKSGRYATRSWCRENEKIIRYLEGIPGLTMIRCRFWEYPFVFKTVMERPQSNIIDIGAGNGVFDALLARHGHTLLCVDKNPPAASTGVEYIDADARDLTPVRDDHFDAALLVSVIEHIPSNTIWCERRQAVKTGPMLREEIDQKVKALSEAVRVVKPGGRVIITSDIYLDYPPDMNISWRELIGLGGIDLPDIKDFRDVYVADNPIHKGRGVAVGMVLEKCRFEPGPCRNRSIR